MSHINPSADHIRQQLAEHFRAAQAVKVEDAALEIRAFKVPDGQGNQSHRSGIYSDLDAAARDVAHLAEVSSGSVYVTLNPVRNPGSAETINTLQPNGGRVKDEDVIRRSVLLVDVDPTRPTGTSATDAEKKCAAAVLKEAGNLLREHGFSPPMVIDSGNGYHLLYPVDLPNDEESQRLVKSVLKRLDAEVSTDEAKIDTVVHNASRITKIAGTISNKGEPLPERPHRVAKFARGLGEEIRITPRSVLEAFAPADQPSRSSRSTVSPPVPQGRQVFSPALSDEEVGRLLCKMDRQRLPYDKWIYVAAAVYDAVAGDVERAIRLLKQWAPEDEEGEYEDKMRSPLRDFKRSYLYQIAGESQPQPQSKHAKSQKQVLAGPSLPQSVFDALPGRFGPLLAGLADGWERDLLLVSSMTVVGSLMYNVIVHRADESVRPFIYIMGLAPASSGKGTASKAKRLGERTHRYIQDVESRSLDDLVGGEEKHQAVGGLFCPADTSQAALIRFLSASGGKCCIFATEGDTLSRAMSKDYGGFDDTLRRAFHHETIDANRIISGMQDIADPAIAVVVLGTPDQFSPLIKSTENGLFSRFGFYLFTSPSTWISKQPTPASRSRSEAFDAESDWLFEQIYRPLQSRDKPLEVTFTDEQWDRHNARFAERQAEMEAQEEDISPAPLRRAGVLSNRVAALMTVVKFAEQGGDLRDTSALQCDDATAKAADDLALTLVEHSYALLEAVGGSQSQLTITSRQKIKDFLPEEFTTMQAVGIGKALGTSKKTVERELTALVDSGFLVRVSLGRYRRNEGSDGLAA